MKKNWISMLIAISLVGTMLVGCGSSEEDITDNVEATNVDTNVEDTSNDVDYANVKIGAILSFTKNDGGWNQAQYTGIVDAMADLGISEEQFIVVESVAETGTDFTNAAEALILEGCNIIFGVSTGYKSAIEALSLKYPDIQFAQADGDSKNGNMIGYQIRSYDGMFVCGYLSALMAEQNELGYSAGQPESSVIQGINAFALGAKYANPESTVRVVWANSWYDPTAEAECANSLISLGIKNLGINASSPAIPQACEDAGVYCTGYHVDMKDYAPDAVIVSYMWNWAPIFEDIITSFSETGAPSDTSYYWGAEEGCSTISEINTDIVSEELANQTLEIYNEIISGELMVLSGEINDNEGNVVVKDGEVMTDEMNRSMDFLVENVIGQLP
jgi:basic membrane lipoprotein Med (substrate-binding protein (PBP1-ABC) superfamily)